jgi:transcriptional regulator with XRE-family HTH domain
MRQKDLAKDVGLTPSYLSQLMGGKVSATGNVVLSIHDRTKIPVDELRIQKTRRRRRNTRRKS